MDDVFIDAVLIGDSGTVANPSEKSVLVNTGLVAAGNGSSETTVLTDDCVTLVDWSGIAVTEPVV
jgi:hypothetical protein